MPELSGEEHATAAAVAKHLVAFDADTLIDGLGGTGLAAIYESGAPGPAVLVRCELDGLPITETGDHDHRSRTPGKAHLCGHDGHMAIMLALASTLHDVRPRQGRVVLLFQPAEENGKGARAVVADPRFQALAVDYALSLHNLPGHELHQVLLKSGHVNCASRGMRIRFSGKTAHASMPETGRSPALAMAECIEGLNSLSRPGRLNDGFALVTVVHAKLGEEAFGIAPGHAEIWATLRSVTDVAMDGLIADARAVAEDLAAVHALGCDIGFDDVFHACVNDNGLIEHYRRAAQACGFPVPDCDEPMRFSEDFGEYASQARSAMFFLGAGTQTPALHNPDYDFPDALIASGAAMFHATIARLLGDGVSRPPSRPARD